VEQGFAMAKGPVTSLIHFLRVAATKFDDGRLFQTYAAEARELADRLEGAKYIRVGTSSNRTRFLRRNHPAIRSVATR
jgi:hypothetical protein